MLFFYGTAVGPQLGDLHDCFAYELDLFRLLLSLFTFALLSGGISSGFSMTWSVGRDFFSSYVLILPLTLLQTMHLHHSVHGTPS